MRRSARLTRASQLRKGTRLASLAQEPVFAPDTPVLSAVLQGDAPVLALLARYRAALARATDGDEAAAAALAALTPEMDAASAWGIEAEVRIVLQQLGCEALLDRTMGELSGGQAKRVALATALIQSPDILILDEPTNQCVPAFSRLWRVRMRVLSQQRTF